MVAHAYDVSMRGIRGHPWSHSEYGNCGRLRSCTVPEAHDSCILKQEVPAGSILIVALVVTVAAWDAEEHRMRVLY